MRSMLREREKKTQKKQTKNKQTKKKKKKKTSADENSDIYLSCFLQRTGFDISRILSPWPWEDNLHDMSKPVLWKK